MSTPEYEELETEFGEVIGMLREGLPDVRGERPSEAAWQAIAAGVGRSPSPAAGVGGAGGVHGVVDDEPTEVTSITSARSWGRPLAVLTGVAAALLVAIPLFLAFRGEDDGPDQRADLVALPGFEGSGWAEIHGMALRGGADGAEAPVGAFYELWLVDFDEGGEVQQARSLGPVGVASDWMLDVPGDLDLEDFDAIWVSVEPDDGNPEHSGTSILRGDLTDP